MIPWSVFRVQLECKIVIIMHADMLTDVDNPATVKGNGKGICLTSRYLCNIHRSLPFPLARLAQNSTVDPTLNLCTRYPLLLGGHRQCGFKAFSRLLHITATAGIKHENPRSRVQCLNRSATCSMHEMWPRYICSTTHRLWCPHGLHILCITPCYINDYC